MKAVIPVVELKTISPVVCIKDTHQFFLFEDTSDVLLGIDRDSFLEEHKTDNLFEALAAEGVDLVVSPTISRLTLSMLEKKGMTACAPVGKNCAEALIHLKDHVQQMPRVV